MSNVQSFNIAAPLSGVATINQVRTELLGSMSSSAFWRLRKEHPDFPKPLAIGGKKNLLLVADVIAWCKKRARTEYATKTK